jgi:elongation factor P hydroxylase
MEGKELEEGMTWRELAQVLKERKKVKDKVEVKDDAMPWINLLLLLFNERSFFSLKKDSEGEKSVLKEKSSKRVLDYFFEKVWERPILKSQNV